MKRPALPFLAFGVCGLIWGSTFLAIRIGNESLPPLWALTWRLVVAAIVLNTILFATGQRWPSGKALRAAGLYGLWEFGLCMAPLYWGEKAVPSGLAAALYAVCPLAASFEAKALGMEELSVRKVAAGALAVIGVGTIFWSDVRSGGSPAGLVAVLFAACAAPYAALMLQRGPKQSAIGANAVGALAALPVPLIGSFLIGEKHPIPAAMHEIEPILYLAIMSSVVAFGLFAWLTNHWKTTSISFLGVIVPVIALVLGALVRHEPISIGSLGGAALVLAAVSAGIYSPAQKTGVVGQTVTVQPQES